MNDRRNRVLHLACSDLHRFVCDSSWKDAGHQPVVAVRAPPVRSTSDSHPDGMPESGLLPRFQGRSSVVSAMKR